MATKVIRCPVGVHETVELWAGYCECGAKCPIRNCPHTYEEALCEHVASGFKNAVEEVVM